MANTIVITDGFTLNPGDLSWEKLHALGTVRYHDRTDPADMLQRCADAMVIVTNKTPVTRETISACRELKVIAVTATGYNIIDVGAAAERDIIVCNVPGYGTDSVAQHTFALILELMNHVGMNSRSVSAGEWATHKDFCYTKAPITELAGKTLGIVGYGEIGKKVADLGRAFGMKVIYTRRSRDPESHPIERVFSESDVVSLHCPLTPENSGFVNRELLGSMKPHAILINTARGQLVNEADLAYALEQGWLRGAGLDVLTQEPPSKGSPLIGLPQCVITPHNAWYSFEARQRIMETTAHNIRMALGGMPENVVGR